MLLKNAIMNGYITNETKLILGILAEIKRDIEELQKQIRREDDVREFIQHNFYFGDIEIKDTKEIFRELRDNIIEVSHATAPPSIPRPRRAP